MFSGVRGEFCTGDAADGGVRGEFCPVHAVGKGGVLGELCIGAAEEPGESCRGGAHGGCVYVRSQSLWRPLVTRGTNFACNSPQGISSYEIESLRFCRFVPRVDAGSVGIACDFEGWESCVVIPGLMAACD